MHTITQKKVAQARKLLERRGWVNVDEMDEESVIINAVDELDQTIGELAPAKLDQRRVPAGRSAVEILGNTPQCELVKGDIGYIDGHVRTGDERPHAAVVRLSDGTVDYVPVYALRVIGGH